ncbi:MAG: hypothetical protein HUU35_16010, partial [Armatimonadetes bacterium]|nr:hypothetical protein [Armatimonadota bacterium]
MLEALAALDEAIGPAGLALLREELGAEADAAAWLRVLEERAQPLVAALRTAASAAQGPDWPEQNWDSYYFSSFEREEWAVTVPFAVLPAASSAVVPVAAAERILGVPESLPDPSEPWARPQPGRFYRRYWPADRRFLTLVADIAARFLE